MSTLPKSRLRIAGDLFRFNRLVDLLRPSQTNQFEEETPLVPRFHGADSLQIEIAVFNDGVLLTDLSAITELELVIKPLRASDAALIHNDEPNPDALRGPASNVAPIVCKRIGSEHFNTALTDSQWQTKAANMAHAVIALDSEEAALSPGERWLSLIALGADAQARTLAAGPVLILGGGPTFNALPQPVVKDLRDQAAQSAAEAQASASDAATSAQQAANAALAAQEQAVLASTGATQAGTAAADAQLAATTATHARDAAQLAQGATESARDAAQQSEANATDEAGRAESDADRSTTQANRSEAQADRAQSIADNLQDLAEALSYRGEWAGTSAPTGAQRGYFWVIGGAGVGATWGGFTWDDGDAALYNGSMWQRVALDGLLAQANANIDALRLEINLSKQPQGGMYFTQAGGAVLPSLSINDLAQGGTQSFALAWCGRVTATGSGLPAIFGNTRGSFSRNTGSAGIQIRTTGQVVAGAEIDATSTVNVESGINILNRDAHVGIAYNSATKVVSIYVDGVLTATGDWSTAPLNAAQPLRLMLATTPTNVNDPDRSTTGYTYSAQAFSRDLTAGDFAELAKTGSKIVPVALRENCVLNLQCDDGAGYQLRDHSGNGQHALVTATGGTHLIPSERFEFVWTRVSSGFLGDADRPVLPDGAVIESVIWSDAKSTKTTASLGYNASNVATHVASFTPTQSRQNATLAAGSMAATDRRLYLHMSANAGAVTVRVKGRVL